MGSNQGNEITQNPSVQLCSINRYSQVSRSLPWCAHQLGLQFMLTNHTLRGGGGGVNGARGLSVSN